MVQFKPGLLISSPAGLPILKAEKLNKRPASNKLPKPTQPHPLPSHSNSTKYPPSP